MSETAWLCFSTTYIVKFACYLSFTNKHNVRSLSKLFVSYFFNENPKSRVFAHQFAVWSVGIYSLLKIRVQKVIGLRFSFFTSWRPVHTREWTNLGSKHIFLSYKTKWRRFFNALVGVWGAFKKNENLVAGSAAPV